MSDWISAFVFFFAVLVATGTLLFFLLAGQYLPQTLGVPLSAFQVADGMALFLFALTMIFGEAKPEEEMIEGGHETAIFPLAAPSIASSGTNIVSRVMGLILASVATSNVLLGLQQFFAVQRSLPVPALPLNASLTAAITRDGRMAAFFIDERKMRLA